MGTTAEKLTYLNTTKGLIKDSINALGGNLTNQSTFRSYAAALDSIYNVLPKTTGTGTTLSLSPTLKGLMQIDLKGNTSQEGTPTPDSPQDIHNVSGNNTITICGKNVFDVNDITTGEVSGITSTIVDDYLHLYGTPTGTNRTIGNTLDITNLIKGLGTSTFSFEVVSGTYPYNFRLYERDINNVVVARIDTAIKTITYTEGHIYQIAPFILSTGTTTLIDCDIAIQLEKGATNTDIEAYQSQNYPINLPTGMELCKIGDYQDSFVYDNDKWYKRANVGKVVLDGSESWQYELQTYKLSFNGKPFTTFSKENPYAFSTHFNWSNGSSGSFSEGSFWYTLNGQTLRLEKDANPNATTLSAFKTWLSTNNVSVYYVLPTSTDTEITDTTLLGQLNAIKGATSYTGTTNIMQTNNDEAFIIDASCLKGA